MNQAALLALLAQARARCGHTDYVVIGSLSVLALESSCRLPADMTLSVDVDCYTRDDPGRVFDLLPALGENSDYHRACGIYLDGVSPHLASLPDGWQNRLIPVEHDGLRAWFLDPVDAAVSKYARGEPRDLRWIRAGIVAGLVSLPMVQLRLRSTTFLDAQEQHRAQALVAADQQWFEAVQAARQSGASN